VRGGPRRSRKGVPGVVFGWRSKENLAENLQPDCLQVPRTSRDMALELVCGADFSCILMCGAGPGDIGVSRGVDFGWKSTENSAENLKPDCLQIPKTSRLRWKFGWSGYLTEGSLAVFLWMPRNGFKIGLRC